LTFAKQEGIIPAPEGNHAIKGAIDAALECKEKGESKTILFNLCGHGYFDMSAYDDYLNGSMADDVIDDDGIGKSISQIPRKMLSFFKVKNCFSNYSYSKTQKNCFNHFKIERGVLLPGRPKAALT